MTPTRTNRPSVAPDAVVHAVGALVAVAAVLVAPAACPADPSTAVVEILDRVEARGADVGDLKCKVVYVVEDRISEDTTKRTGTILFKKKSPNPVFMVTFDRLIEAGVIHKRSRWYLFDGRYFTEAIERSKSIIRRDVAPPGTEIDLFSIEKAPFPIPFGQKKAEILHNFDVTLAPAGDPAIDHLICTPKPQSRLATDYSVIEFFVSRKLHLPVKIIMTTNPPDKVMTAEFPDLNAGAVNTGLSESAFKLPARTRKYSVTHE